MFRHIAAASCLLGLGLAPLSNSYAQMTPLTSPTPNNSGTQPAAPAQSMGATAQTPVTPTAATTTSVVPPAQTTPPVTENSAAAGMVQQPPISGGSPTASSNTATPADQSAITGKPLLVIRFNQNHVYFAHSMEQAIRSAEKAKSGISYTVVSYVPAGSNREQTDRVNDDASNNLQSVVNEMQSLGVQPSQIAQTTLPAQPGMTSQEVQIFVH